MSGVNVLILSDLLLSEGRFDEPVRDGFRHHINHADDQVHRPARGSTTDHVEQLPTEREDVLGVSKDGLAHLGREDPATGATQQLFAELLF